MALKVISDVNSFWRLVGLDRFDFRCWDEMVITGSIRLWLLVDMTEYDRRLKKRGIDGIVHFTIQSNNPLNYKI